MRLLSLSPEPTEDHDNFHDLPHPSGSDLDPTISVGGILKAIGGNIRVGSSGTFLTEACEYTNSFLHFFPKISVYTYIY